MAIINSFEVHSEYGSAYHSCFKIEMEPYPKLSTTLFLPRLFLVLAFGSKRADKESKATRAELCAFKDEAAKLRARLACVQGRRQAEQEQAKRKIEVRVRVKIWQRGVRIRATAG